VPIGVAFGIIMVIMGERQYEVATFRQDIDYKDGRRPSRIEFATAVEDAHRRDFTINGMFYDPLKEQVLDFVGGREDLQKKLIRAIGDPHLRIKEDRLRMIRALRLACRFRFAIDLPTEHAIRAHAAELMPAVAIERVWQELDKAHAFGNLAELIALLSEFRLLQTIFPELKCGLDPELVAISRYPKELPVIAFICGLFPGLTELQLLELCKRLKVSSDTQRTAEFLLRARHMEGADLCDWAYFYASPYASTAIAVEGSNRPGAFEEHASRRSMLQADIERIQCKQPLVTSERLKAAGVVPGKAMGLLLKEAERMSINEQLTEADEVIARLKRACRF
jgi:poly(A) polymerase